MIGKLEKIFLVIALFSVVTAGVAQNLIKQYSLDQTKLPPKIENSKGFQRWITNMKNKGVDLDADEFKYLEDMEIYNSKWTKVFSIDDEAKKLEFENTLTANKSIKQIVYSPGERSFVDYRNIIRGIYSTNEVIFYGIRDDKMLESRVMECYNNKNCVFDRGFFIDNSNDVFVISEISLQDTETEEICSIEAECVYAYKLHMIDLVNNKHTTYISKPETLDLQDLLSRI